MGGSLIALAEDRTLGPLTQVPFTPVKTSAALTPTPSAR